MIAIIVSLGFLFICFVDINPAKFSESEETKVDVFVVTSFSHIHPD